MKHLVAVAAFALSATAFAAAPANPPACPGPNPEMLKLHREIAAIKLDRLLNVSRDQARSLLPILQQAVELKDQVKAEEDKREPAIARALAQVRDDLRRDGTVSDASRKSLQDARGDAQLKDARKKLMALREQMAGVLTMNQHKALRQFDPRPLAGVGAGECTGPDCPEAQAGEPDEGPGRGGHGHKGKMAGRANGQRPLAVALTPEFVALIEARAR